MAVSYQAVKACDPATEDGAFQHTLGKFSEDDGKEGARDSIGMRGLSAVYGSGGREGASQSVFDLSPSSRDNEEEAVKEGLLNRERDTDDLSNKPYSDRSSRRNPIRLDDRDDASRKRSPRTPLFNKLPSIIFYALTALGTLVIIWLIIKVLSYHPAFRKTGSGAGDAKSSTQDDSEPWVFKPEVIIPDTFASLDHPFPNQAEAGTGIPLPVQTQADSLQGLPTSNNVVDEQVFSNGTHEYRKTVIMVSMDGLRPEYLERDLLPNLVDISEKGLRAKYMEPIFPSLTFPNHWAMMTGLYAESHGIVANDFYDPTTQKEFVYTDPAKSWDSSWWGGEPIWAAAERVGIKSAVLMWPGPPYLQDQTGKRTRPHFWYPFQNHVHYSKKVDQITTWLDMSFNGRPQFIAAYLPEVDQQGHRTGPVSDPVDQTLRSMDAFAKDLHSAIVERNLSHVVDVIVVSDHGMTSTSNERLVYLDDVLGEDGFKAIEHKEGWPSCGLRFSSNVSDAEMLARLQKAAALSNGGFSVYTHETMPERYHFSGNPRIAPVYLVPHVGWVISDRTEHLDLMKGDYHPKGNHGYDPTHPDMHAIFIAHGPFAERLKTRARRRQQHMQKVPRQAGEPEVTPTPTLSPALTVDPVGQTTVIDGFKNVELYNLVARLLGIDESARAPNNGTSSFWDTYLD